MSGEGGCGSWVDSRKARRSALVEELSLENGGFASAGGGSNGLGEVVVWEGD